MLRPRVSKIGERGNGERPSSYRLDIILSSLFSSLFSSLLSFLLSRRFNPSRRIPPNEKPLSPRFAPPLTPPFSLPLSLSAFLSDEFTQPISPPICSPSLHRSLRRLETKTRYRSILYPSFWGLEYVYVDWVSLLACLSFWDFRALFCRFSSSVSGFRWLHVRRSEIFFFWLI